VTHIAESLLVCLGLWLLFMRVVLVPLLQAAKRADEELAKLQAEADYREALRRAVRRGRGA
jgi:hypothetical protein